MSDLAIAIGVVILIAVNLIWRWRRGNIYGMLGRFVVAGFIVLVIAIAIIIDRLF